MTVASTLSQIQLPCNGTATQFSYSNKIFQASDLVVTLFDVAGNRYQFVNQANTSLGLSYVVQNVDVDTGCVVVFNTPPPNQWTLDLRSQIPELQSTSIKNQSAFLPELHEEAFDRLTREVQDLYRQAVTYSIRAQDIEATPWNPMPLPSQRRGMQIIFDSNGAPTVGLPTTTVVTPSLLASMLGILGKGTTSAETAALVSPVDTTYAPGNILRYGVNSIPGTTDMTTAFQAALNQASQPGGAAVYIPTGTFLISAILNIGANTRIYGDGSSSVVNFTATVNNDYLSGAFVSNCRVEAIQFNVLTVQAGGGYTGVVAFHYGNNNAVVGCEITGATQSGILIDGCSNCYVARNYLHNFTYGTGVNDSSDIHVMTVNATGLNADNNIIENNQCFGGNNIGISLETSATPNLLMRKTVIQGNRVGTHTAYGILVYTHQTGDGYVDVLGNYVEGITGSSSAQGGSAGAGIYVTGTSAVKVANNTIYNCCSLTTNATLSPGGIGIAVPTGSPCIITGNSIYDISQNNPNAGPSFGLAGIYVSSIPVGSTISGNLISQQVPVGANVGYSAIELNPGGQGTTVNGNSINVLNTIAGTRGIFLFANGGNLQNVVLSGNLIAGCSGKHISLEQNGGFVNTVCSIVGNVCSNGGASCTPINITASVSITVAGNSCNANTTQALVISGSTSVRVTGNLLATSGSGLINTAGTCTGSFIDESNSGMTITNVNNAGTGSMVSFYAGATPQGAGGTWQQGDTAIYNVPGAASQDRWRCTTGGTSGTWTALTLP